MRVLAYNGILPDVLGSIKCDLQFGDHALDLPEDVIYTSNLTFRNRVLLSGVEVYYELFPDGRYLEVNKPEIQVIFRDDLSLFSLSASMMSYDRFLVVADRQEYERLRKDVGLNFRMEAL
jgi:hypothetical protein